VDWGPDFARDFGASFPDAPNPPLSFDLGPLALAYILSAGGSGYFRMHAVTRHIAAGTLHLVSTMPSFSYPIYVVQSADADDALFAPALAGLREAASASQARSGVV
jgi:hypothetical protein